MADRSVLVRLRAEVGSFVSEMERARQATERLGRETERTQGRATGVLGELTRSATTNSAAWERSGAVITAVGTGIIAIVGAVVASTSKFEVAMATVAADTRATGGALAELRAAAIEAGAATSFSATEAAEAIDELAKAGVATSDILAGGLAGSMALAAAGGLDVAKSAEIASAAMVQFGLGGDQVGHIADLLAAGAGKALGSVEDLGMALNQGGLVAAQMGLSIEETTGTLAAFASAGLKGSDAGTSLKTMLLMLANPSEKSAATMRELGINAYDAAGNFVGMESLAGQLQQRLGGLSQAQRDASMATIFGSDAIRAANVLFTNGSAGIADWTFKVNDAGYAAEQAALKLDTLQGDWEYLTGDLEALALTSGGSVYEFLRTITQGVDDVVVAFSELPDFVQSGALSLGAVAGTGLLAAGALVMLTPAVLETVNGFRTLAGSSERASRGMATVGKAAAAIGIAAAAWAVLQVAVDAVYDGTVQSLSETTKALLEVGTSTESVDAIIKATSDGQWWNFDGLEDAARQLSDPRWEQSANTFLTMSNGADKVKEQIGLLGDSLGTLVSSGNAELAEEKFNALAAEWERGGGSIDELKELMPGYTDALADAENAQASAAPSAEELAGQITGVGGATADAADAVDGFGEALDSLLAQFFSVDQAADDFQKKINGLSDAVKENGRELEGTSDKAIANREALRSTADAAANYLKKLAEQGASSEEVSAKAVDLKKAFLDQAEALGLSGTEVDKVAAAYDAMPRLVEITLQANGLDEMSQRAQSLADRLNAIPRSVKVTVQQTESYIRQEQAQASRNPALKKADGGLIPLGMGGPREDNVLTWTSSGEYVINAAATSRYLPLIEAINAQKLADGGMVRGRGGLQALAGGGAVGAGTTVSSGYLSGAIGQSPGPVNADRYAEALARSAFFAKDAEAAERMLARTRERSEAGLEALRDKLEAEADAQAEAQDRAEEAAAARVEALREERSDALGAIKDKGAKARAEDAYDAKVKRAQEEQAALKKANTKATKELKDAQADQIKLRKAESDKAEEQAENRLTFAKERAKDATEELKDSEKELADARKRALDLAESIAGSLTSGAGLASLFGDSRLGSVRDTAAALAEAQKAADGAGATVRGEGGAAATQRRAGALRDLAGAAREYAAAQAAAGASPESVAASLGPVLERIRELGSAYGVAGSEVEKLTASIASAANPGAGLLESMGAEAERVDALADAVKRLAAAGLDDALLDQVIAGGTSKGLALAQNLLGGGQGYIDQVNGLQSRITSAGNALGTYISGERYDPSKEIKVAPIKIESGTLTVDGGKLALSEAAALDAQTMSGLGQIFRAAAASIPPPIVNITTITQSFGKAP